MRPRLMLLSFLALYAGLQPLTAAQQPNLIVIITDDQGFGDLACHGNPFLDTPNLDALARESLRLSRFYVSPVCSPTRASLMTGRWNYRTGVVDTYIGRSMMHADERTLAEVLREHGYRTALFGKWHLGDNYPLRPQDQGFDEVLMHRGGGIGQPSDPPENRYHNPRLQHNGLEKEYSGYCTDIFFDSAIEHIKTIAGQPFFVHIATNAPHTPLEIDGELARKYLDLGLDEVTAKVYAMVENIDVNIGKLVHFLDDSGLSSNTIVIYLHDNGPQFSSAKHRYTAALRDGKGSVYEGGIRSPLFVRWPGNLPTGPALEFPAAHVDLYPTLLEMCGIPIPNAKAIDGVSLLPWLKDPAKSFPERNLFLQWHRGDAPRPYENSAVVGPRYKLVNGQELYDIIADPQEKTDLAAAHPDMVSELRAAYDAWFAAVASERGGFHPPRIHIDSTHENPVLLTPQDWRGEKATWPASTAAHWEIHAETTGTYRITLDFVDPLPATTAKIILRYTQTGREMATEQPTNESAVNVVFEGIALEPGPLQLGFELSASPKNQGVRYARVEKIAQTIP